MSRRWRNLQQLIGSDGEISIGYKPPVNAIVAAATDEHQAYAMLRVAPGEPLHDILDRLDAAVARAVEDGISTDEINQ